MNRTDEIFLSVILRFMLDVMVRDTEAVEL